MHKILIELKKETLTFSLYPSNNKSDNLNNTNVINTEKMVFTDKYIDDNLDLVKSFFNLIAIKKNVNKVNISINAIFPLVYRIISDISNIKTVVFLEEKQLSYIIFEYLLTSKHITNIDCFYIPAFMFDKLAIDKDINIKLRSEVLFLSNFMEKNKFNTYSDVYYKKSIDIDCHFSSLDKEDIESFFRINNNLKIINIFNPNKESLDYLLDLIKKNNKKNIKIILNQQDEDRVVIALADKTFEENKKIFKNNGLKIKVNYTKEYRDKNTLKQVNLNFFRFILLMFIIIALLAAIVFFIKFRKDTDDIEKEMDDISEVIDLNDIDKYFEEEANMPVEDIEDQEEVDSPEQVPSVNPLPNESTTTDAPKPKPSQPNAYYTKFSQAFDDLLKINDETVGWLKINNTNINYPVTQHKDNDYYLNHSLYKKKNSHGWIFMDYRNNVDNLNKNTIIYGHRNNYGVMFANLKNVLEKRWYTNKNNQVITFNTVNQNMKWQIFSIYTLKNTNDYLQNEFSSDEHYQEFINMIKSRSIYDFGVEVGVNDNILTLSTCYNNAEYRLVVHAKLIK